MFSTLNIGSSALFATQRAVEAASQNIANATVDGYSRQTVKIATATPTPGSAIGDRSDGMRGNGVVVLSVDRMRDQLADSAYRSEAAADGYAGARATTLDRAQGILGSVTDGATSKLDAFWSSFDALSNTPTDAAARDAVLNAGEEVARTLRDATTQLDQITSDAASEVSTDVASINNLASQVANLNQTILDATASGQSPNDLLDARDRAIDQLTTLAGVTVHQDSKGIVDVYIGTQNLVRGNQSFGLTAGTTPGTGVPTVSWSGDGTSVAPGGEIGGYLAVTTVDLPNLRSMLDNVAVGLRDAVNTTQAAGKDLSGTAGAPFFTGNDAATIAVIRPPDLTGAKIAASESGAANDGNHAIALADLRSKTDAVTFADGTKASVGDALRAVGGKLGALAAGADATHSATNTSLASADKSRESANGVSVDEEMVDLVKYQHAYSAAAKVISTADAMLDTLINHLGA